MKALFDRQGLLDAVGAVAGVIPNRTPKPILQSMRLHCDPSGSVTVAATDLEIAVTRGVLGATVEQPGTVLLPSARTRAILAASTDEAISLSSDGDSLLILGERDRFNLPSEDPDLYPVVPGFDADSWVTLGSADLKRLVKRTVFATEQESTRYALRGVAVVLDGGGLSFVGTDGRRLAKADAPAETDGGFTLTGTPVIPAKVCNYLLRNLDEDAPPVHLAFTPNSVSVRTDQWTGWARLVEGRFPRFQDVFPKAPGARVPVDVGAFHRAVAKAAVMTGEESRGIDHDFAGGRLILSASASDVGNAKVELPIEYDGPGLTVCFDARYLADALKVLDPAEEAALELIDAKSPAVLRADRYAYVVMPLTRER